MVEAKGRVVPQDSIQLPVQVPLRSPKVVKAGKPRVVSIPLEAYVFPLPDRQKAGSPTVRVAGQNGYSLPKRVAATPTCVLAGIPEKKPSQTPLSKDQNPKNITTFGLVHGLKNLNISEVVQDKFGNLWIATGFGGVSKYDGKSFTTYTEREGLCNNTVLNILKDRTGNLWFATQVGASRFDGKYFTNYTVNEGLPADIVNEIIEDKHGNIWFATYGGIARLNPREDIFTRFTVGEGLAFNLVNRIFEDNQGIIWAGTYNHGLSSLSIRQTAAGESFTFRNYTQKEGLPGNNVLAIAKHHDGTLWFGTDEGACQYKPATEGQNAWFRQFTTQNGLIDNRINTILVDKQGQILFGTEQGITIYEDADRSGRFTHLTEQDGLPNHSILSLFEDPIGNIWIGTESGVSKYSANSFRFLTEQDGLTDKAILAILEDRNGTIWLGTYGSGVIQYHPPESGHNGTFSYYTTAEGLSDNVVYALYEDRKGHIWIGTREGGVTEFTPSANGGAGTFTQYTQQQGLLSNFIVSMLEDQNGHMWFGQLSKIAGGVSRFDGKTFTNFTQAQGLNSRDFWSIAQDKRGTFWFGSWGEGFTKYEPAPDGQKGRFTHFDKIAGLSADKVRPVRVDRWGAVWFGTIGGGVSQYKHAAAGKPARFIHYTEREGLSNNDVRSILEDRKGNLWFGNYYGISRFSPTEGRFVTFTQEDGFLGTGCMTNSICEDRTGKIWIGTTKKLTVFDPEKVRPDTTLPNVQLTDIRLFNERIAWQTDTSLVLPNGVRVGGFRFRQLSDWYAIPEGLSLPYNHNFIDFDFVGINTNTPQMVRYQYQLDGLDDTWSSPTNRSEAAYGNLLPGAYTFRVRARNGDGRWSQAFQYAFRIRPPWWETGWAYVVYTLFTASIVYAIIQYRVRQGLERIRALEAIRTRISSDLHDDVGSILSGLAMQSQMIALTAGEDQKDPLNEISDMSHEAMDRMRDTVWAIDSRKDKYENLVDRMRAFAEKNLNLKQISHNFEIAVDDPRQFIDPQTRQNIYLIFKEAISNICKHSDARQVTIQFRQSKSGLYLLIHDNGSERKPTNSDGLGLKNMAMRATQLGGHLVANYDNGFTVELVLGKKTWTD
ncbi:two-component regulator propeller domain-containing protein [uncultured Fibrella sp.]|uniref:sensor histidine kinase n=1 Tax=uncultured Fibrella sp. TaxID=1284596 RepID=UPI0035CA7713